MNNSTSATHGIKVLVEKCRNEKKNGLSYIDTLSESALPCGNSYKISSDKPLPGY
jgi:hypothetical protein